MANQLHKMGKRGIGVGDIDLDSNKFKLILCDANFCGPSAGAWIITAVTNTVNPTITTSAPHGLAVGNTVAVKGVQGATGANGNWKVASVPTTTTFTITLGSAPGAYTSGGYLANLSLQFLSQFAGVAGAITARSPALTGTTMTADAEFQANNVTFSAVTGQQSEFLEIVRAAALPADADLADSAQRLVHHIDTAPANLPFIPNGSDYTVTWPAASPYIFEL